MQKEQQILCAYFLQAMCFHSSEHVLSLFFSDLSKLGAILWLVFLATCFEIMQTTTYLVVVPIMQFIPSSWPKQVFTMMATRFDCYA